MKLYPAIDLRGGRCVRLYQGDYDQETQYSDDPVAQALSFAEAGADWIHVVDLDAARTGESVNRSVIAAICAAVSVPVQCGGGVRTVQAAAALAEAGVARVVIGTAALESPELVATIAAAQPVAVGLDARGHELAGHGWQVASDRTLPEMARRFAEEGVDALVVTEIAVDGTLAGPSLSQLGDVLAAISAAGSPTELIASGGVGTLAHLGDLAALRRGDWVVAGAIMGQALSVGAFTLTGAVYVGRCCAGGAGAGGR